MLKTEFQIRGLINSKGELEYEALSIHITTLSYRY
jgi:hypothetical protein